MLNRSCANWPWSWKLGAMGKGRDKQGREAKKKKKVKLPGAAVPTNAPFRHHTVVTTEPETPRQIPE
jgi:hypothetical protein